MSSLPAFKHVDRSFSCCTADILLNALRGFIGIRMRLNKSIGNTMDGVDNDNNGEIDDKGEKIIINNSGVFISLGYRF